MRTSSMAMTTSTVSRLSKPRSLEKWALGLIYMNIRVRKAAPPLDIHPPFNCWVNDTYVVGVVDLFKRVVSKLQLLSKSSCQQISGKKKIAERPKSHLVEALEQRDDPSLNLLLVKRSPRRVIPNRKSSSARWRNHDGPARDAAKEPSRRDGGPRGDGSESRSGPEKGGAEHFYPRRWNFLSDDLEIVS